jgi:hypothetical protein
LVINSYSGEDYSRIGTYDSETFANETSSDYMWDAWLTEVEEAFNRYCNAIPQNQKIAIYMNH